jgi:hypothetical protein
LNEKVAQLVKEQEVIDDEQEMLKAIQEMDLKKKNAAIIQPKA